VGNDVIAVADTIAGGSEGVGEFLGNDTSENPKIENQFLVF